MYLVKSVITNQLTPKFRRLNEIINIPSPAGKGDRANAWWMRGSDGELC